ncbi:MAG TPA: hypothetical protein VN461_16525 [Vicinamibacteria bacterium]|nr:hypothetical protein [Vicinamibacteria bacterium]
MKKKAETKGGATKAKKAAPAGSAVAAKRAGPLPPSSPRVAGGGVGADAHAFLADQVEKRLVQNARQFEEAKKRFEKAARARVASHPASQDHHLQKELTDFGFEMRLLTARRTELLWVQQQLGQG